MATYGYKPLQYEAMCDNLQQHEAIVFFILFNKYMLLINISTDKVLLADGTHEQMLDRNGIEDTL